MDLQTYDIKGVEIFSIGTWNGDEYTMDDLQTMVQAFDETRQGIPPYLKLGHDEDQTLVQRDGMPAAGWIQRLYILGDKLMADFKSIPEKIYNLISAGAYKKVSSEIYWDITIGEKLYKRLLGAVSLLGADMPAVSNLADIMSMYKMLKDIKPKTYSINTFKIERKEIKMEKTEKEIKLELELEALKADKKQYALDLEAHNSKVVELEQYKKDAEAKKLELILEADKAKNEAVALGLMSEKLCTPAMKPYILELLGNDKKEYSFGEKKLSKQELLKETLKLFKEASKVNFEESSSEGDSGSKNNDKEVDERIKQYAKDNNVSYGVAAKEVLKIKK